MVWLEKGEFGPDMPLDFISGAQGMATGYSNFVNFNLTEGEYVALCVIPDPKTGLPHFALGMMSHFTVTEKTSFR
jgi:hypothetical protein